MTWPFTAESPIGIPLQPIWAGFLVNTLFYATILWLLIPGPFVLRRVIRQRRGLCPACAYAMGESGVCSECGKALPASRASRHIIVAPPEVGDQVGRAAVWLFVAAFFIALLLLVRANALWQGGPILLFLFLFTELTTAVAGLALLNVLGIWFPHLRPARILAQLSDRHMKLVGVGAFLLVVFVIGVVAATALVII